MSCLRTLASHVLALFLTVAAFPAAAQLTDAQKVHDFQNLAALYAKTYAPVEWKRQLIDFDVLNIAPWLDLVRDSKSDLEFIEICYRYVGALQDSHSAFFFNSSFAADSGLFTDIYDGKVLVEAINRTRLPLASFPIRVGDEVVAIDGKPVAQLMDEFQPLLGDANYRFRRRIAADVLSYRRQSTIPRAVELGDSSVFQIKSQNGAVTSYTIPWTKTGFPVTKFGPVPSPRLSDALEPRATTADVWTNPVGQLTNLAIRENAGQHRRAGMEGSSDLDGAVLGFGSRTPVFAIPNNFTIRRGLLSTDNFFTATYEVAGRRLGYLRIPSFSPASQALALNELLAEIIFFNANTDGLIVDVTRNPGGSACYTNTVLSLMIPNKFTAVGFQIRATLLYVNSFQAQLEAAKAAFADATTIERLTQNLAAIKRTYEANRELTETLPLCTSTLDVEPVWAGTTLVSYAKPLIVLADELSASAADVFASAMQDSKRGPIIGMPTNGAGGTVVGSVPTGNYSESYAYTTTSLLVRPVRVNYPGLPSTPYIENIGVWPDLYLDYMTTENLLNLGRPYVDDFTGAILREILKAEGK
jgi:C-terminal processing protease CtpA/Prc